MLISSSGGPESPDCSRMESRVTTGSTRAGPQVNEKKPDEIELLFPEYSATEAPDDASLQAIQISVLIYPEQPTNRNRFQDASQI